MICLGTQGEMIQAKFGLVAVAERQLETYSTAVLLATESPPKPPRSLTPPPLPFTRIACVSCLCADHKFAVISTHDLQNTADMQNCHHLHAS